jgi:hypothetical protein
MKQYAVFKSVVPGILQALWDETFHGEQPEAISVRNKMSRETDDHQEGLNCNHMTAESLHHSNLHLMIGRLIFWEITVSVILSKKVFMYICPIPNGFRDRAISLYSSKIVIKKETLHTVSNTGCIVHVTKLVQLTKYNTLLKIPQSTSMHFVTHVRRWHVARLSAS